jgi:hypothetical protein
MHAHRSDTNKQAAMMGVPNFQEGWSELFLKGCSRNASKEKVTLGVSLPQI